MIESPELRRSLGYYLGWVAINMVFLFVVSDGAFDGRNSNDGVDDFVPLNFVTDGRGGDWDDYDITEFLAYTLLPLVVLGAFRVLRQDDINTDPSSPNQKMKYSDYLSDTPFIREYPHNVVELRHRDGRVSTLFVDNRRLSPPVAGGPLGTIEEALTAYLSDHPDVAQADIYVVESATDRRFMESVRQHSATAA